MDERRAEDRYTDSYDVEVKLNEDGEAWTESTVSSNISPNGVCFVTDYLSRYVVGQHVDVWVGLPDAAGDMIGAQREGVVAWKSDDDISTCGEFIRPRVGVSFLKPLDQLYS